MKAFLTIMLAEIGWLFLAASGPVWAFLLGFVGFVLTPAITFAHHERVVELAQRVEYSNVLSEVSRG